MTRAQQLSSPVLTGEAVRSTGGGLPPPLADARPSPVRTGEDGLPAQFRAWFASRGWQARPHQLALIEHARAGQVRAAGRADRRRQDAGRVPAQPDRSRGAAARGGRSALHTLYISPLKALAVDVARNLETPVAEMGLAVRIETRTGDTPAVAPPAPEAHCRRISCSPRRSSSRCCSPRARRRACSRICSAVVLDELHAMHNSKRGDLLALGLARLRTLAPGHRARRSLGDGRRSRSRCSAISCRSRWTAKPRRAGAGARREAGDLHPRVGRLCALGRASRASRDGGCDGRDQACEDRARLRQHAQPGRAHVPGTVADERRQSADRAASRLARAGAAPQGRSRDDARATCAPWSAPRRSISASTGARSINVICIGAPKGAARLVQRIGRANHRLDEPSQALLVPANRFEVLECEAARDAVMAGELDGERLKHRRPRRAGAARAGHGLCRAVRCRRALCRSAFGLALSRI